MSRAPATEPRARLRAERDFSDSLIDNLPGVFFLVDADARFLRWNSNLERVTGYAAEEIRCMHPLDFFRGDDARLIAQLVAEAFAQGHATVAAELVAKDGTGKPYLFTEQSVTLAAGRCLIGTGVHLAGPEPTEPPTPMPAEHDIKELIASLERSVRDRTAELVVANQELESFTYAVSHDLRAPLRALDGFSLALMEDYADAIDEAGRDQLNHIRTASSLMGQLIDDLMRLSSVTLAPMSRDEVDLSELARSVMEQLRAAEPHRDVETVFADGVVVRGDGRLLRTVLENLLGNAWKFSRPCRLARIEFGVSRSDGVPVYHVSDSGVGFDPAHVDKLFQPFRRLHPTGEFEGDGMGLAIVARIVRRHHGRIWAEGLVGRGARVSFTCDDPREPHDDPWVATARALA